MMAICSLSASASCFVAGMSVPSLIAAGWIWFTHTGDKWELRKDVESVTLLFCIVISLTDFMLAAVVSYEYPSIYFVMLVRLLGWGSLLCFREYDIKASALFLFFQLATGGYVAFSAERSGIALIEVFINSFYVVVISSLIVQWLTNQRYVF